MSELYTMDDVEQTCVGWTYTAEEIEHGDADQVLHDYWNELVRLMNADIYAMVLKKMESMDGYFESPNFSKRHRLIMAEYLRNSNESIWL